MPPKQKITFLEKAKIIASVAYLILFAIVSIVSLVPAQILINFIIAIVRALKLLLKSFHITALMARQETYLSAKVSKFKIPKMLMAFSWFCSRENREIVELLAADLKKDAREMKRQGYKQWFTTVVIFWRSMIGGIIPIMWDGIWRSLIALLPIIKIAQVVKRLF